MLSPEYIHDESEKAAAEAAKFNHVPFIIWPGDIENWSAGKNLPIPFPTLGDYVAPGYEPEGDARMVDTSGFGADDEPALTLDQMFSWLETGKAYAFITHGQFQSVIQCYRRI